jgi:MFS superfamily sulfate permease-like transporter
LIGFNFGIGFLIIISQLPRLLGYAAESRDESAYYLTAIRFLSDIPNTHLTTALVGISNTLFLLGIQYWKRNLPAIKDKNYKLFNRLRFILHNLPETAVLIIVMVSLSSALDFPSRGINTLGTIIEGEIRPTFFPFSGMSFDTNQLTRLFIPAMVICIVGFIETSEATRELGYKAGMKF